MEWLTSIKSAIAYMEDELLSDCSPEQVAAHVHMSCMYLQRGFQMMTGYTLGEYMRNRRLYLAAVELTETDNPVIEIALKYGYENPASFDKAFARFHRATPLEIRNHKAMIRSFHRLTVTISIEGGDGMQYSIERKGSFTVVGFERVFRGEDSKEKIPLFWDEMIEKHASHLMRGEAPVTEMEAYVASHHIGELGVCTDDMGSEQFHYMIAGYYVGGEVPEGMAVRNIDAADWAVFPCTMDNLQDTNSRIFKEWIPGNSEYTLSGSCSMEWYSPDDEPGPKQHCQIWIPVMRK